MFTISLHERERAAAVRVRVGRPVVLVGLALEELVNPDRLAVQFSADGARTLPGNPGLLRVLGQDPVLDHLPPRDPLRAGGRDPPLPSPRSGPRVCRAIRRHTRRGRGRPAAPSAALRPRGAWGRRRGSTPRMWSRA